MDLEGVRKAVLRNAERADLDACRFYDGRSPGRLVVWMRVRPLRLRVEMDTSVSLLDPEGEPVRCLNEVELDALFNGDKDRVRAIVWTLIVTNEKGETRS